MAKPRYRVFTGSDIPSTVWRVVDAIPAAEDQFLSQALLGAHRPKLDYLALYGVSMHLSLTESRRNAQRWNLGTEYAELDLRPASQVCYAITSQSTGHLKVWAPPDALLMCVINYAEEG